MDELKAKIADAFNNFDDLKTPACLDAKTIGMFAENRLSEQDTSTAEAHIKSCLYCLGQLTEMKELLYLTSEAEPVSPDLEKRLEGVLLKHHKNRMK
jgi:hypothetical protein